MAKIGVKVTIKSVPVNDFFNKYIIPDDFQVTPFSYLGVGLGEHVTVGGHHERLPHLLVLIQWPYRS
jgi:hypothetical protein